MMAEEKLNDFYEKVVGGSIEVVHCRERGISVEGIIEGKLERLLLRYNPEIRSLIEASSYKNKTAMYILFYLSCDFHDELSHKILASKLKELYESGDLPLIREYQTNGFFCELTIEELLFLVFDSNSLLTENLLTSMRSNSLEIGELKSFLRELGEKNNDATIGLIDEFFFNAGV